MADIIVCKDYDGNIVFADPLDDSSEDNPFLPDQAYYTLPQVIQLLNDLGFNVSNEL